MIKRKIVNINEEKCNGCGVCIPSCHEGALKIIDGKARLIGEKLCDGLGNCLGECPQGAITIIEREADEFDEKAVQIHTESQHKQIPHSCPGTMSRKIDKIDVEKATQQAVESSTQFSQKSELNQWPIQLMLAPVHADYFEGTNLLIAADCTAYAYGSFHQDFIKGHVTLIGCPKLDDNDFYSEKLTAILQNNKINSITVVRMEVPCCSGIVASVKKAMLSSQKIVPYREVIISINGELINL